MQKINIHKWYLVRSALSSSFTHFLKNWKIFIPWNDIDKNAKVIFSHFWGLFEVEFRPTWHDIMLCNSCVRFITCQIIFIFNLFLGPYSDLITSFDPKVGIYIYYKPKNHFCYLLNKVPMMSKKGRILLGDEGLDGRGGIPR